VRDIDSQIAAAEALVGAGAKAVLVKGGHLPGPTIVDLLVTADATERFESPRIDTAHTHGTGCTLASAIATGLAQHLSLHDAVARAREYVLRAIRSAPGYGHGHGPLDHAITVRPLDG
jgi:hydroxymethylpyrimidine/phosphomethylpyrimidine kinase